LPEDLTVREAVMQGVGEISGLLERFNAISDRFAEPMDDEEMTELLAEQAELQDKIDAAEGWDLDRTLEVAADALRLPPWERIKVLSGWRAPPCRPVSPAVVQARHAAAR
jgi:energy-dependent translational throttle protein EttA